MMAKIILTRIVAVLALGIILTGCQTSDIDETNLSAKPVTETLLDTDQADPELIGASEYTSESLQDISKGPTTQPTTPEPTPEPTSAPTFEQSAAPTISETTVRAATTQATTAAPTTARKTTQTTTVSKTTSQATTQETTVRETTKAPAQNQALRGNYTKEEWLEEFFRLTNELRISYGREPLRRAKDIDFKVAEVRAKEIIERFAHIRPDGSEISSVYKDFGHEEVKFAENIAGDSSKADPKDVIELLASSPGHFENMLDPRHEYLAVGHANIPEPCYERPYHYLVQLFYGSFHDEPLPTAKEWHDEIFKAANKLRIENNLHPFEKIDFLMAELLDMKVKSYSGNVNYSIERQQSIYDKLFGEEEWPKNSFYGFSLYPISSWSIQDVVSYSLNYTTEILDPSHKYFGVAQDYNEKEDGEKWNFFYFVIHE